MAEVVVARNCPVCEGWGAWWPQSGAVAMPTAGAFLCLLCKGTGVAPPPEPEMRNYRER